MQQNLRLCNMAFACTFKSRTYMFVLRSPHLPHAATKLSMWHILDMWSRRKFCLLLRPTKSGTATCIFPLLWGKNPKAYAKTMHKAKTQWNLHEKAAAHGFLLFSVVCFFVAHVAHSANRLQIIANAFFQRSKFVVLAAGDSRLELDCWSLNMCTYIYKNIHSKKHGRSLRRRLMAFIMFFDML